MQILLILVILALFFAIAELFGRSKHIGRWWTFALLTCTPVLPGIIALILSPSAKSSATSTNVLTYNIGRVLLIIGIVGIVPAFFAGPFGFVFPLILCVLGAYLFQLGKGNIVNIHPKYYFNFQNKNLKFRENTFNLRGVKLEIFNNNTSGFYYLLENEQQSEPYTFEELKAKKIKEDELVWRKGLDSWVMARNLSELRHIIVYYAPAIQMSEKQENNLGKNVKLIDEFKRNVVSEKKEIDPSAVFNKLLVKKNKFRYSLLFVIILIIGIWCFVTLEEDCTSCNYDAYIGSLGFILFIVLLYLLIHFIHAIYLIFKIRNFLISKGIKIVKDVKSKLSKQ